MGDLGIVGEGEEGAGARCSRGGGGAGSEDAVERSCRGRSSEGAAWDGGRECSGAQGLCRTAHALERARSLLAQLRRVASKHCVQHCCNHFPVWMKKKE